MLSSLPGYAVRLRCLLAAAVVAAGGVAVAVGQAPIAPNVVPYAPCPEYSVSYSANYAAMRPVVAPPFQWGHFGAQRQSPQVNWHRDYHGNLVRWAYLRR